jgi:iron complex transport system ATP-binding protein
MSSAACLEIQNLTLHIGSKKILDSISLSVGPGECVGLVGPNGSGKTTLLQAILGFSRPSSGRVLWSGEDVERIGARARSQEMAYVAQDASGALPFTVESYLQLAYFPWQDQLKYSIWEKTLVELCHEFKLRDKLQRNLATLSGGERQRVILVQSLLQRPRLLLLDEITNHLDIAYQLEILQYLARQSMTRVLVLHDINLALRFCDRLVLLKEGRCLASGPSAKLLTEAMIQELFGVSCTILKAPNRRPYIVIGDPG